MAKKKHTKICPQCGNTFASVNSQQICCSKTCGHRFCRKRPVEDRFWRFVIKDSGCWLWTGASDRHGYGYFRVSYKTIAAHRVSWTLHNGVIPPGVHVCHHCDVPACVRIDHLFLGSPADNMADMDRKGRRNTPVGSANGIAKLTESQALSIRSEHGTLNDIAQRYGVSDTTIGAIKRKESWTHVQ